MCVWYYTHNVMKFLKFKDTINYSMYIKIKESKLQFTRQGFIWLEAKVAFEDEENEMRIRKLKNRKIIFAHKSNIFFVSVCSGIVVMMVEYTWRF